MIISKHVPCTLRRTRTSKVIRRFLNGAVSPSFYTPLVLFVVFSVSAARGGVSDCEGIVPLARLEDLSEFVEALLGQASCPFEECISDLDQNGTIDGRDIAAFMDCVLLGDCPTSPIRRINEVQPFDWTESQQGFGFYTSLNTNIGAISGGTCSHSSSVQNGMLCVQATHGPCGTSFEGRFISLLGLNTETQLTVDLADPLPPEILQAYRSRVSEIRVRVQGVGQYRLEVKDGGGSVIYQWPLDTANSPGFVDRFFAVPASLPSAKLLNLVVESVPLDSNLCFDRIDFVVNVPAQLVADPLLYGFVSAYSQLLRGLGLTGFTRDRNIFPGGSFDSVPAMGLQILGAALARDLGIISVADAQNIAEQSVAALLSIPREPTTGLLPHFLQNGIKHPDSEWSSVDTAIACIAAVEGLQSLGMTGRVADIQTQLIGGINFAALTQPSGEISHGVSPNGKLLQATWNGWGGELTLVEILRAMTDPSLPPATANRCIEHFEGIGFIIELAALFVPEFGAAGFGPDQFGVDWHARRVTHLQDQAAFAGDALFGLSAGEVIRYSDSATDYLAAGIGTTNPLASPLITLSGYGTGPWIMPHYMSMTAALDIAGAEQHIRIMRDERNQWCALNGPPESIDLDIDLCGRTWNRDQVTLNAAFHVIGLYHAIRVRDGGLDVAYGAVNGVASLQQAVDVVFKGLPLTLEGESATGQGQIMTRSSASGTQTLWLHAGESASWNVNLATCAATTRVLGARYSNDNFGPLETVAISVDNQAVGSFQAQDTGDFGNGRNIFVRADDIATTLLAPGAHTVTVSVSGGDGFGVEIDLVDLSRP